MKGFNNEPLETPFENGRVLPEEAVTEFTTDDDRFDAVEKLVDSGSTNFYDAKHRLGYDAVEAAQKLISVEELPHETGIAERITTIEQRFGFMPRTRQELSDAYDLTGKELVAGAATHLNIVLQRQKKYMEEPSRTVRSIVGRYADYAKNARVERVLLQQTEEAITDEKGALQPAKLGTDWKYSGSLARPLLHTLWSRDVSAFTRSEEGVDPLKNASEYATSNKQALENVQKMIDVGKKSEFADEFLHSMKSEKARFDFWVNVLQEARKHTLAAGVAHGALVELGVIEDERRS